MKFLTKKDDLVKGIQLIQISSSKAILPILSNALLEVAEGKLILTGTDLEINIRCQIEVNVLQEGSIVLPVKKLIDIIRDLPEDEVQIEMEDESKVTIQSGKSIFHLFGLPKTDFPTFPEFSLENSFNFTSNLLKEMVRKTVFACAVNEVRYVLNGVYWMIDSSNCKMVATDGHRLAFINKPLEKEDIVPVNVIIPTKTLYEINRITKEDEDIQVAISQDKLVIFNQEKTFISKLIEGQFPNYERVIPPKQDNMLRVNAQELLATCHRVSLMASEKSYTISFLVSKGKLTITANTPNLGEAKDDIEIVYDDQEMELILNYKYVMDVLKNIDSEEVSFSFQSPKEAVVIRPIVEKETKEEYICVVMPMKI